MPFQVRFDKDDERLVDEIRSEYKNIDGTVRTRKGMIRDCLISFKKDEDLLDEVRYILKDIYNSLPSKKEVVALALKTLKDQIYQLNGADVRTSDMLTNKKMEF